MPRRKVHNYEEQVYAGVLGKIIGVYLGRPFEGWPKAKIEERFGRIDRYVHEDLGKALVVADDDISGTFTFVRALEDSGLYADTPDEYFGDTWLNYVLENRTIFWWGGVGMSTEHTAFVRLIEGVKSPQSGAIETNGRTVAEQIGAQIFIDAFGMVSPGDPALVSYWFFYGQVLLRVSSRRRERVRPGGDRRPPVGGVTSTPTLVKSGMSPRTYV